MVRTANCMIKAFVTDVHSPRKGTEERMIQKQHFGLSTALIIHTYTSPHCAGNSSSNPTLATTFILNNSCIKSFAAYGIVIFVIPSVFLQL